MINNGQVPLSEDNGTGPTIVRHPGSVKKKIVERTNHCSASRLNEK
jgi:hypothetical protein